MFQGMTAVNPMHLARRLSIVPRIWHQVRSRSKHRIRLPMIFARLHESIFQSHFREITNWSHHLHILWLRGCLHRFKPVAYQHSSFILKFSKITFFLASSRELVDWNYFVTFPSFNGSWNNQLTPSSWSDYWREFALALSRSHQYPADSQFTNVTFTLV